MSDQNNHSKLFKYFLYFFLTGNSYFNEATDNFMKELVDFNSRKDFDKMMG